MILPERAIRFAEIVVVARVGIVDTHCPLEQSDRAFLIPCLVGDDAREIERVRVVGVGFENPTVDCIRSFEIASLVQSNGATELSRGRVDLLCHWFWVVEQRLS